jgi:hypothetical protein
VVLEIFSRDQQVMGLLLPDAGPPELLGFDDRTMMYEGEPIAPLSWRRSRRRSKKLAL